jgi:hypothetical protein
LINNQGVYKRISPKSIKSILNKEPHEIRRILAFKTLVRYYDNALKECLLSYPQSAEILLTVYEVKKDFSREKLILPESLSVQEKDDIVSRYIDLDNSNPNYYPLIQNSRNKGDFRISDKTRLKAKRKHREETARLFDERTNVALTKYGVSITFPENATKIKDGHIEGLTAHYAYSLDFIREDNSAYSLYLNFKFLFEYVDKQNRINLVSKVSQMGVFERVAGLRSQNEYVTGFGFNLTMMTSQAQIFSYSKIISSFGSSLEEVLELVFTSIFAEQYGFPSNARISIPSTAYSTLEKVRLLAPEFESALKQYKLFALDGHIDFELLQISSVPSTMQDVPSLNEKKYIYLNKANLEVVGCVNLFFSDQTLLSYVEPCKDKSYRNFFDLLSNEEVLYENYETHQKPEINYLIEKGFVTKDEQNRLGFANHLRMLILKDLYENEVASYYHFPEEIRLEIDRMFGENIIHYDNSLFSKPEQDYFNYHLNKQEFTNGFDLRNSYLHGTQANPDETEKHENAYLTYLKLLTLAFLKMEDDLMINQLENRAA